MDWGRFALGFVGGAADKGAQQLEQRQKNDAELKKEKMLQELRLQTEKDMAVFNHDLTQHDTDPRQSGPDLSSGKYIYRDSNGTTLSERDLTASEKMSLGLEQQKGALDVQNLQSTIASRAHDDSLGDKRYALDAMATSASVDASRASAAHSRAATANLDGTSNSGLHGSTPDGGDPDLAAAGKLISLYKNEIAKASENGGADAVAIRNAALAIVKNSRTGAEAERQFNLWLTRLNRKQVKGLSLSQ